VAFPNFADKHAHDALVEPADFVSSWVDRGVLPAEFTAPEGVVVVYQRRLFDAVLGASAGSQVSPFAPGAGRRFGHPRLAANLARMVPAAIDALQSGG
jgi:hypothetical protein